MRRASKYLLIDISNSDRKSTRLNSSHQIISYAVFCLKKKKYITGDKRDGAIYHMRTDVLISSVSLRRPPGPTLFPYTTLFRSVRVWRERRKVRHSESVAPRPDLTGCGVPCLHCVDEASVEIFAHRY